MSTITVNGLEYGAQKSQHVKRTQQALAGFLLPLTVLEFDRDAAADAAIIRAKIEKQGTPLGPYDLLIAGLARSCTMTLVTNNIKEFARIDDLCLESWVE